MLGLNTRMLRERWKSFSGAQKARPRDVQPIAAAADASACISVCLCAGICSHAANRRGVCAYYAELLRYMHIIQFVIRNINMRLRAL